MSAPENGDAAAGATSSPAASSSPLGLESGKALMAQGPQALHDLLASRLEKALGHALPQMELRFQNLSVSADMTVVEDDSDSRDLPTLWNTMRKSFAGIGRKKQVAHKEILKSVTGSFKPGTMTLVLGQPGSGKSSLMKMLAGRFPVDKTITVEGDISYNGKSQSELIKNLPQFVAYVTQRDKHFAVLTVKETLEFAHQFCGGELLRRGEELLTNGTPEENAEALSMARAIFDHYPEIIIEQLGLRDCQNTIVGDALMRGISGGERKRVTTGEMEFGMKYVTLMDEISTGLDSAATFDIMSTQRSVAKKLKKTVVIALLQPAPEVVALFDDVMILNAGEVMYHGPVSEVEAYFESLGFKCPPGRDLADYLMDLGTNQQYQYQVDMSDRQGYVHPRQPSEFAELFRRSPIYERNVRELEQPQNPVLVESAEHHIEPMPVFHQSFWENTRTLMRRQLMITFRNKPYLFGRGLMITVMGLLYATTFYQFDPTEIQVVMGIIFAGTLFLSLGQASQLPTFMAMREIFYKQRGANFFRTSSYVLANSISQLPICIAETLIFGTLVYWMCGFVSHAEQFFLFLLVLFLTNVGLGSFFFALTSAAPDINIATPISMASTLIFIIFAGFIITESQIPDYFIWIYWITPVSWTLRALAVIEYRSPEFDVCDYDGINYCTQFGGLKMGEYYLGLFDIKSEKEWVYYSLIFMVAFYFACVMLGFYALEYKRYETPENVTVTKKNLESDEDDQEYKLARTPRSEATPTGEAEAILEVKPQPEHFTPVTVAFENLRYFVPDPANTKEELCLLKGITGFARPGSITALMGASGAGKTTLMDVIANRKTGGRITGKILLNGYEANELAIRRCTGYCEQMDIHSEASTIREALTFSAFLRQDSSIPDSTKYDTVEEVLSLLDMHDIADKIIRGSSTEQMKRLTIGVELAAQPSVLFLDEPTSGLDARSAKMIMDGVRKVADSGRTVVCTIHQPSSEVFFLFDSLLLLKRGGETVFFGDLGPKCHNLVDYFEAIPGVSRCPPKYNPATWMLEVIGAGVTAASADAATGSTDFVDKFNASRQREALDEAMQLPGVGVPSPDLPEMLFARKRAASSATQAWFLIKRFFDMYWRSPTYNLTRLGMAVFLALLFGVTFTTADYSSYQGLNSGMGMIFMATLFVGMISFQCVLSVSSEDRPAFYRERASQTYNAFWYFLGSTVVEIPYVFGSGFVFTAIFYPLVQFTGFDVFLLYWINLSFLILMLTYMGQMFVYGLPSEEVAAIIGVLINSIFFLFMGFSPPADLIPEGYQWLYKITPQRFSLSILGALVFADCSTDPVYDEATSTWSNVGPELGCQPLKNSPVTVGAVTVKQFTESVFGMKHDEIWTNFFVVLAYIVGFRLLALVFLRFVNSQKR